MFGRLKCWFDVHDWFWPLPWHGKFSIAWKRCRRCGLETIRDLPDGEYEKLIKSCNKGNTKWKNEKN